MQFDIAKFVLSQLKEKRMTQKELAKELKMKPSQLNRILHAEENCTIDTISKIYFKLGYKATIQYHEVSTRQTTISYKIVKPLNMPNETYLANIDDSNYLNREIIYGEKFTKGIYKQNSFITEKSVN